MTSGRDITKMICLASDVNPIPKSPNFSAILRLRIISQPDSQPSSHQSEIIRVTIRKMPGKRVKNDNSDWGPVELGRDGRGSYGIGGVFHSFVSLWLCQMVIVNGDFQWELNSENCDFIGFHRIFPLVMSK